MDLSQSQQALLDDVLDRFGQEMVASGDDLSSVTLAYTHGLHRSWRLALRMLPVAADWTLLDVGSGLGLLAFEIAGHLPVTINGVDLEPRFVEHSNDLLERLDDSGYFTAGAHLEFSQGDAADLSFASDSFDLVFMREILQFCPTPQGAVDEVYRVTRPGRYACISDLDSQLRLSWPLPSPDLDRLVDAVTQVQHQRGGDRQAGRKLSTYMRSAGFEIVSVVALPEAAHRTAEEVENQRELTLRQLRVARSRVVDGGAMGGDEFDTLLAACQAQEPRDRFEMDVRIIVLGRKPEQPGGL